MANNKGGKIFPRAVGKRRPKTCFDRNRNGLFGGLPEARVAEAPGAKPEEPHPPRK